MREGAARQYIQRLLLTLSVITLGLLGVACNAATPTDTPAPTRTSAPVATAPQTAAPTVEDDIERIGVRIGGLTVRAETARTPEERGPGLGGRASMPLDEGMLFIFQSEGQYSFWMRGMLFPLDFIWISSARVVVDITIDVPTVEPSVPDGELQRYRPDQAVLYMLEVNAGVVREAGVQIGDAVTFDPEALLEPGQQ